MRQLANVYCSYRLGTADDYPHRMSNLQPFTMTFHWPGMPRFGAGRASTVYEVDGVLPEEVTDPVDWNTKVPIEGTWYLDGVDRERKIASYTLKP